MEETFTTGETSVLAGCTVAKVGRVAGEGTIFPSVAGAGPGSRQEFPLREVIRLATRERLGGLGVTGACRLAILDELRELPDLQGVRVAVGRRGTARLYFSAADQIPAGMKILDVGALAEEVRIRAAALRNGESTTTRSTP